MRRALWSLRASTWFVLIFVLGSVAFWPSVALAREPATPSAFDDLSSPWTALGLAIAVVLVAFLVNRFAPKKRKHVRRTLFLLLAYLVALGCSKLLEALHSVTWALSFCTLSEVLGIFCGVGLVGVIVFDIFLPAIGLTPAVIVTDLAIGGAYVIATILVLRHAGVDLSGIVTTSAVVTGILALSLQSTLGNVIGGVALQIDDSIRAGDWIQLENGKQGRVRQIRWRHTVIETRDWDTLIVPNAALLTATIIILGKREAEPVQHRMWVYFNVGFHNRPGLVIKTVEDALRAAPIENVAESPPPNCICYDFARDNKDSFAYYAVRYWLTDLARDDPTSSLVRTRIFAALERAGIPIALPSARYVIENDDADHRERRASDDLADKLAATRGLDFLAPLTEVELTDVAASLRCAPFVAGETITRQGAIAHWLYIVSSGTAEVHVASKGGKGDKSIAKITAPGFFGEMGLLTGEPRTATVTALTDVICYRLDKHIFVRILNERPTIAGPMSAMLAERKVELLAARDNLDAETRDKKLEKTKTELLATIESFFGLSEGAASRRSG